MKITISTTIDAFIHKDAKDHNIAWNDALEFGIKFLIAEKEGIDYPANKLLSRIANFQKLLAEQIEINESLKTPAPVVDAEKEVEDLFKDMGVPKDD